MRVRDQFHTWEEGRSIVFDDSLEHEVYNKSDDLRVVLIVDFLRPMPFRLHAINWAVTRLARHSDDARQARKKFRKYT